MPRYRTLVLAVLAVWMAGCSGDSSGPTAVNLKGKIVFLAGFTGSTDIYAIAPDGGGLSNLTRHPAYYDRPVPSPDGNLLAFYRARSSADSGDLFVMRPDGSHLRQLTHDPFQESWLAWRPDGSVIAFMKGTDIYTITPGGGVVTRITFDSLVYKSEPRWSPDGNYIAYMWNDSTTQQYEIHRIAANGTGDTALVELPGNDASPAWSADGQYISFDHNIPGTAYHNIYRLRLQDGMITPLTSGPVIDLNPSSSPAGDTLVFTRYFVDSIPPPHTQELFLLAPPSVVPTQLTHLGPNKPSNLPVWVGEP